MVAAFQQCPGAQQRVAAPKRPVLDCVRHPVSEGISKGAVVRCDYCDNRLATGSQGDIHDNGNDLTAADAVEHFRGRGIEPGALAACKDNACDC